MTSTTEKNGRLGNQIIRNLAVSLIAEKNDLYVDYSSFGLIKSLGINLFTGNNKHNNTTVLNDDNYFSIYNSSALKSNLNPNSHYFQTKEIINLLHCHLNRNKNKKKIMKKNPYNSRYNTNNDLLVHIRLTDVAHLNPGPQYYIKAIKKISHNKLYITTDDSNHLTIKKIQRKFPHSTIINYDEIQTIQFASTCKNIILSHGSFSAVIGYLSFFSNIYYPKHDTSKKLWYGDMFNIKGWKQL